MLFINFYFKEAFVVEIAFIDHSKKQGVPFQETRLLIWNGEFPDTFGYFLMNISYFEEFQIPLKISKETNKDIKRSSISFIKNGVPIFAPSI